MRFLVHGGERSGPPLHVLRLCRQWDSAPPPFDVDVVLASPGELITEFRACRRTNVQVARLDRRSPERLAARLLTAGGATAVGNRVVAAAARARCDIGPADVTVVNGATAATAFLARSLPSPGRMFLIAHELSTGWQANIDESDRAFLLSHVERYAAVSNHTAAYLGSLGIDRERIVVIPPAVDIGGGTPRVPSADGSRPIVIGSGGVTDWRKGTDLWLLLAHELRRIAPDANVRFVWFGGQHIDDRSAWPIRHEVDHLGLRDVVEFVGPVADPGAVLSHLDIFVSTAREDAAPLVCAEAAGHGVPVITFDSGGAAELVADGRCGVVVPYPDVASMATAVLELVVDERRRVQLGRQGASFVNATRDSAHAAAATADWITGGVGR